MKIKIYLLLVIIISKTLNAQTIILENQQKSSIISYELRHPAHDVKGTSKDLQVKIEYDTAKKQIINAIAQVKVSTFSSGNSNRDSHAMELIEALKYPLAKFKSTKIVDNGNNLIIYGNLTFHGVTKNITINASKSTDTKYLSIKGNFAISLDEFQVERPKLLFVPSEEYLKFEFYVVFNYK